NDLPGVFDARGIYESWISRCVDGAWSRRRVRLESRFGPDPVTRSESGEVATAKNAVGRSGHARNLEQRDRVATRASEGTRREGATHRHGGAGVRTADRGSTCEGRSKAAHRLRCEHLVRDKPVSFGAPNLTARRAAGRTSPRI